MTPERWVRVKEVLGAALELPETERTAFLEQSCDSDLLLRAEVERLRAAHLSQSLESPVTAPPELAPGQILSHYRIEAKLGQGGMGAVYKAHDEKLQRPVALKVLSSRHFDSPAARQRFLREARAASVLNHPHIVTIY
jgi:serine/threonine protein kinase